MRLASRAHAWSAIPTKTSAGQSIHWIRYRSGTSTLGGGRELLGGVQATPRKCEVKRLCSEPARSAGSRGLGLGSDTALRPLPLCQHLSDRVGEGCRLYGFPQKGINAHDCRVLGVYK